MKGERRPTEERLAQIGDIFGIGAERLANASFDELLQNELADPKRYRSAEKRIAALDRSGPR